jgi:hypothetical protein
MADREFIYGGEANISQREIVYPPEPVGGLSGNIKRHEWADPYDYLGYAIIGSLETESVWTITRLTVNGAGVVTDVDVLTNVKWSERAKYFKL